MTNAIVNLNGQIIAPDRVPEQAKVSVFDRSYLYGDSLYEVARTYDGKFFGMKEHLERLEKSAALAHMVLGQSTDVYAREMQRTIDAFFAMKQFKNAEAYCRIVVSRGVGRIGFGLECLETPTQYAIIVQPLDPLNEEKFKKGRKLRIVDRLRNDSRALDPAMKSGNYLNSLLGYLEARSEGYEDALFCNADGHLTEGSTYAFAYIKNGIFVTSPVDIGILDSITRRHMLRLAREIGMETREVRFPRERVYEADEVITISTIYESYPVIQVDDRIIGNGKPGPFARKLWDAYQKYALSEVGSLS
jgi:branched-chain amino acid aminotransferase